MRLQIIKEKEFYRDTLAIMLPVAAQQAINMGVNMMDTIMLGSFGEVQLSASSLANAFYNIFNTFCLGIIGGCSILMAQYWGAGKTKQVRETLNLAIRLSVLLALFFAVITWFFPAPIMRLFTEDKAVVSAGTGYLKVTAFIYLFHGSSYVTSQLMRAVKESKLGMYASCVSFIVNVIANWILIFGYFGAPRLEIVGAACGTLIARLCEFALVFFFLLKIDKKLSFRLKDLFVNPSGIIVRKYLKIGVPVMISDGFLAFGNTSLSMVIGRIGTAAVAANSICQVVDRMFTVIISGISNASGIVVGNSIGEGKKEKAYAQGQTFYFLSVACGAVTSILLLAVGPLTLYFYDLEPVTIQITREMMKAYAVIIFFQCIQFVMTKGVLRGGGDTRFLMIADILFMWVASIPLGILVGIILKGPAWLTVLCLRIDYLIKAIWCLRRLMSGKWIKTVYDRTES